MVAPRKASSETSRVAAVAALSVIALDGELAMIEHLLGIELGGERQIAHVGGEHDFLLVFGKRESFPGEAEQVDRAVLALHLHARSLQRLAILDLQRSQLP